MRELICRSVSGITYVESLKSKKNLWNNSEVGKQ
jgi:hypothetical protein